MSAKDDTPPVREANFVPGGMNADALVVRQDQAPAVLGAEKHEQLLAWLRRTHGEILPPQCFAEAPLEGTLLLRLKDEHVQRAFRVPACGTSPRETLLLGLQLSQAPLQLPE